MIEFPISQMAALVLDENFKLSNLLKSQINSAPSKADIWRLRCEKEELLKLRTALSEIMKQNLESQTSLAWVQEELEEVCEKYA
ncbi:hypothetical protein LPB19_12535 [Marinobacter salinisoli]|uniref:Uncharacterized protein n=1 Tax=Marinobacter salinisoli TaxID=2769486 RepID=A0ABX7MP08_9GAMM|nr:hypothetical protein [Marinobacter salinisoli]QSP94015.1 hypothetical protein LPB19_12535 [Marinobacter salinisoli]